MVKKPHSEVRWRQGRIGLRIHADLRAALQYLAKCENRPLSNYIETALIETARERLVNRISESGERLDDRPWIRRVDEDGGEPTAHAPFRKLRQNMPTTKRRYT